MISLDHLCIYFGAASQFEALLLLYRMMYGSVTQCFSFGPFLDEEGR